MTLDRHFACLAAALLLSACGGGNDSTTEPEAPTEAAPVDLTTVRQVISPVAGGSVRAGGLALDFPAAALGSAAREVALVTRSTPSGAIASFRLEPAGAQLRQPATLSYSADAPLPALARLFWNIDGVLTLMPGQPVGNTLSSTITSLGYAAGGGLQALGAGPVVGRKQALGINGSQRVLADTPTPGGSVEVRLLQCQDQIASLNIRLSSLDRETDEARVIATDDELLELSQSCEELQLRSAEERSCAALARAVDNARLFAADSFANFRQMVIALSATTAAVQKLGAPCALVGGVDAQERAGQVLASKFDQFLSFVDARVVATGFADATTARDLAGLIQLEGTCRRLALDALCDRFSDDLYPRTLDILRRIAFDACRATGAQEVTRLHALGLPLSIPAKFFGDARYSVQALEADAVYCTNPGLSLKVFQNPTTLPEEIVSRAKAIDALGTLGDYNTRTAIKLPPNGSLQIAGRVRAMRCADGTQSNDHLEFRLSGQELARYARSGDGYTLETQPLDFLVERDLARLGLPAINTRTLTLVRVGGGCEVGDTTAFNDEFTLFTVTLDLTPTAEEPPPVLPPPIPASVWAGSIALAYTFEVAWDESQDPAPAINCGFINSFAGCATTSAGSYSGRIAYELGARTRSPIELGVTGDVVVDAGTVSGTLSGSSTGTGSGSDNGCTKSGSGSSTVAGQSSAASTQGAWRLRVGAGGLLELGNNRVDTTMTATTAGSGTSSQSAGCPGGASTTPSNTPSRALNPIVVQLSLGLFTGTVDPGSNTWQGSETLRFERTGPACESLIVDTPAQGPFVRGVTSAITCNATLRATWNFQRQ